MADFQGKLLRYPEFGGRQGLVTVQPLKFTGGKVRRIPTSDSVQLSTLGLGTVPTADALAILPGSTSDRGVFIKALASHVANLFEAQNNGGTILFAVSPDGEIILQGSAGADGQIPVSGGSGVAASWESQITLFAWTVTSLITGTTHSAAVGELVRCDPSSNGITVTLPAIAAGNSGNVVHVKIAVGTAGDAATNNVTVDTTGSDTIDGSASFTISKNRDDYAFVSDGSSDWQVI
jgi:hypothetical protein